MLSTQLFMLKYQEHIGIPLLVRRLQRLQKRENRKVDVKNYRVWTPARRMFLSK